MEWTISARKLVDRNAWDAAHTNVHAQMYPHAHMHIHANTRINTDAHTVTQTRGGIISMMQMLVFHGLYTMQMWAFRLYDLDNEVVMKATVFTR